MKASEKIDRTDYRYDYLFLKYKVINFIKACPCVGFEFLRMK